MDVVSTASSGGAAGWPTASAVPSGAQPPPCEQIGEF